MKPLDDQNRFADTLVRDAADKSPAFSESLHTRVMREVSAGGARVDAAPTWHSARWALVAMVLLAAGVAWQFRPQTSAKTHVVVVPNKLVVPQSVQPDQMSFPTLAVNVQQAGEKVDAFVDAEAYGSLDRDAKRLVGFVMDQLDAVPLTQATR